MEPTIETDITNSQPAPEPRKTDLKRALTGILLVLTVAFSAYLLSQKSAPREAVNLVGLVGTSSIDPEILLESASVAELENAVHSELGYNLIVPTVEGASIVALGIWDADRNVRIPVITYDDPFEDIRFALVLNYAMLDNISSAVFLDAAIRRELEEDRSYAVVSGSNDREVVLWRSGDDIFLAIAEHGARSLIPRIIVQSSFEQG